MSSLYISPIRGYFSFQNDVIVILFLGVSFMTISFGHQANLDQNISKNAIRTAAGMYPKSLYKDLLNFHNNTFNPYRSQFCASEASCATDGMGCPQHLQQYVRTMQLYWYTIHAVLVAIQLKYCRGAPTYSRKIRLIERNVVVRQVFIKVYSLEIQSVMLVFSTQLCEMLPL